MRVYLLAKKIKVNSSDIVSKLALLKIDVVASSKIDELTVSKAKLLLKQTVSIEEIADELDLSVEKLLKKLLSMKINVVSHLSVMEEKDLIRLLKLKNIEKLQNKTKLKRQKLLKPQFEVLKIKPKTKRVFEVAIDLGVSEFALLKKLRQMNSLALHRRSPIDEETIERLKLENYRLVDKILFRVMHFFEAVPHALNLAKQISQNSIFYVVIIIILLAIASLNIFNQRNVFLKQKEWDVKGARFTSSMETYQVLEIIGLIEVKKLKVKIPVVEEGKDNSPITAVLAHKNVTVQPGRDGISVLQDKNGSVSKRLENLSVNDILIISSIDEEVYYYRVIDESKIKKPAQNAYKSIINILLANGRKIVAVLQKIE